MKIQVNVSDDLVKQIDEYANMMGISRSALCATFIGQGVLGYNKSFKIIDALGQKLADSMLLEKTIKEVASEVDEVEGKKEQKGRTVYRPPFILLPYFFYT